MDDNNWQLSPGEDEDLPIPDTAIIEHITGGSAETGYQYLVPGGVFPIDMSPSIPYLPDPPDENLPSDPVDPVDPVSKFSEDTTPETDMSSEPSSMGSKKSSDIDLKRIPGDNDPEIHHAHLLHRYGVGPNKGNLVQDDIAQTIARRIVDDGSVPPTIGEMCTLNASVEDLLAGIKIGSDFVVATCRKLMPDYDDNNIFEPNSLRLNDYRLRYDPVYAQGYPGDRNGSQRKNIGCFFDCMLAAADVWSRANHGNGEQKDPQYDFSTEYPYNIGLGEEDDHESGPDEEVEEEEQDGE